jgi:hypothetical protein
MNISYVGVSMGRYLFVAIAPIAAGIGAGLWSLFPARRKNGFLILLSLLLLGLTLDVLFRVVKPAYTETLLIAGTDQPLFSHPTLAISASRDLAQTFTAEHNNLSAVRIMFSSPAKPRRGELAFSLLEEGTRRVIRRAYLPLRTIEDNVRYVFVFPPVRDSAGKTYLLRMSASVTSADSAISLWQEPGNPYPGGELLVNARPAAGDAYFSTYYFTGTHPSTDWQGRRELVIRQGAYVDVRELQLYLEQSRVFREGSITHQKILRAQQALKNREALLEKDNHA